MPNCGDPTSGATSHWTRHAAIHAAADPAQNVMPRAANRSVTSWAAALPSRASASWYVFWAAAANEVSAA